MTVGETEVGVGRGAVSDTVAWVAGEPVPAALVSERLATLSAGPRAGGLPGGGREFRQLRRWIGQVVVAEVVCETAARRAALAPSPQPVMLDDVAAVELGSLAAAVLHGSPYARGVYRHLLDTWGVPETDVKDYYHRNRDLFRTPEALASGGAETLLYPQVKEQIRTRLREAAARRRFLRWLDSQTTALVEICPGWEHPGDPRQPDNTHRH
jgi:[acyl-carrier-protein] S-malonyltransferase